MKTAPIHHEISTAPDTGKGFFVETSDGIQLRVGSWASEKNSRGTVLFFPGRGDYIELYGHPISALAEEGYGSLVVDWRGHGLSDRVARNSKVGHVNSFSEYQFDVRAMLECAESLELPKPYFLVAHSMGACIGLRSLIEGLEVRAAAFSAPMFDIHMASYERLAVAPLASLMKLIGKSEIFTPGFNDKSYVFNNPFEDNTLTNSAEDYARWIDQGTKNPELHTGGPSLGWLHAALKETRALSNLPSPSTSCITFCGDQEETVDVPAIRHRMDNWPNGEFVSVQDAKHELFLELPAIRQLVLDRIVTFFGS